MFWAGLCQSSCVITPCNLSSTCFRSDTVTVMLAVVETIYTNVDDPTYGEQTIWLELSNKLDLGSLGPNLHAHAQTTCVWSMDSSICMRCSFLILETVENVNHKVFRVLNEEPNTSLWGHPEMSYFGVRLSFSTTHSLKQAYAHLPAALSPAT